DRYDRSADSNPDDDDPDARLAGMTLAKGNCSGMIGCDVLIAVEAVGIVEQGAVDGFEQAALADDAGQAAGGVGAPAEAEGPDFVALAKAPGQPFVALQNVFGQPVSKGSSQQTIMP